MRRIFLGTENQFLAARVARTGAHPALSSIAAQLRSSKARFAWSRAIAACSALAFTSVVKARHSPRTLSPIRDTAPAAECALAMSATPSVPTT